MLCGRDAELGSLSQLLDDARSSRSGVLVLRGDPGVGKSALLAATIELASGMRVLQATGVQTESEIAFAALDQFVRPLLGHLDEIPPPQAAALRAALGLGPGAEPPRFLVSVAVLSLLASEAETEPLLCVIDDAQWLDEASAQALTFAARRLEAEGVALLFAAREGDQRTFEAPGLPELRLGGLDPAAADSLLAQPAGEALAPGVRDHLVRATGGNPLALLELPRLLTADQLSGRELLRDPLPVSETVEAAFLERARSLPPDSQTLLLLAAAEDTGDTAVLLRAAHVLQIAGQAFTAAEAAGLVRFGEEVVEFRHPLVRSAVYQGASLPERRTVHETLAAALESDDYADRRAWHRAAAATGRDPEVAAELERSADRARRRSGYAAAAAALERSAALTDDEALRARRLFAAADAAWLAGRLERARSLLEVSRSLTTEAVLLADIDYLRGSIEFQSGEPAAAHEILLGAAVAVSTIDRTRAIQLFVSAGRAGAFSGDYRKEIEVSQRAEALAGEAEAETFEVAWLLGIGGVLEGDFPKGFAWVKKAAALASGFDDPRALSAASEVALYLCDVPLARKFLERTVGAARAAGAVANLPYALALLATVETSLGRLTSAAANSAEALRLARETGQHMGVSMALSALARAEAHRGNAEEARASVAEAFEIASTHGLTMQGQTSTWALAEVEISVGRAAEALGRLEPIVHMEPGSGHPISVMYMTPDLVEAAVRAGRPEAAANALAYYEQWANESGASWVLALGARCRGMLADGEQAIAEFDEALHLHADEPRSFAAARTALVYGESLRRARRRRAAREQLRMALEVFEQIGAQPWADRARAELRASGESARRREPSTLDQLTRQELQIARFVSEGLTNRQVAEQLFLSPRTIDFHLRNVFRKLELTSRNELARVIVGHNGSEAPAVASTTAA
jgi:DNA-binding CsgD family transcriptional regulator